MWVDVYGDVYGIPQLVIEIAASSLSDDLGIKRLLYERLSVDEYWVINVEACCAISFSVADSRSGEIRESKSLPGLRIEAVEDALRRGQSDDDGAINR